MLKTTERDMFERNLALSSDNRILVERTNYIIVIKSCFEYRRKNYGTGTIRRRKNIYPFGEKK